MTSTAGPTATTGIREELAAKLALVRESLDRNGIAVLRFRRHDWFAWLTCGGSNTILLASEIGVAEALVTSDGAWVLADAIDADRLRAEEVPAGLPVEVFAWARRADLEAFVVDAAGGGRIGSDVPSGDELPVPYDLVAVKRRLRSEEIVRYRSLGRDAADAMTEALNAATPDWTELDIAAAGSSAMLRRDIQPALVLVGGSRRSGRFRHATATKEPVGDRAGVVFCGRRAGLYANLTRYVYFREPTAGERVADDAVATIESVALNASQPGAKLSGIYEEIVAAYARAGFGGAELEHHQGGITGYLSREVVASPATLQPLVPPVALAWNPSLPTAKIEDTVLLNADGIEVLTVDPAWPVRSIDGRSRPDLLVRS
jgi:Xaa-Pro aminopeptidase